MRFLTLTLLALLLCVGCEKKGEQVVLSGEKQPVSSPSGVKDKDLAKYQQDYETAKTAYAKKQDSKEAKEAYVITTVRLGTATMYADSLDNKVKYRKALEFYREALKLDPTNKEAKNNKDMIEGIYKQMGRPIPN